MKLISTIFFLLISLGGLTQVKKNLLEKWNLELPNQTFEASIPSELHTDLYKSGETIHPYSSGYENYSGFLQNGITYSTSFLVEDYLNQENVELVFEGLDTYAEVRLNGTSILNADNMFRSWKIDIKDLIKEGENELSVEFTYPVKYHLKRDRSNKYQLPSGNETVDLKVSCYSRKAAYQFGWDWAERFVGCGIWRPVYIQSWSKARLTDFYVETIEADSTEAKIAYHVQIESASDNMKKGQLKIDGENYRIQLEKGMNSFTFEEKIKEPKLWMPNGYGKPNMHLAKVELFDKEEVVDVASVHYGIRTVELINEADSIGTSFYFKVNGQAIFAKGANYVPMSSFPSEIDAVDQQKLISQVKDANMNMLRVWGGGIYENDFFYQLCDQNGILVWQDFMFANSMYTADKNFHDNIKAEVRENIKRIRKHPSLALWCGNNEIEVGWKNWGWQDSFGWTAEDSTEIWNNYLKIFDEEIPAIVAEESAFIPYVSTSPLSNWGKAENFNHSSMHYWGVWHGDDDFSDFKNNVGRFMVEYGFQSYPKLDQLIDYVPELLDLDSNFLKNRQKSYVGDKLINEQITKRYGEVTDIKKWLVLSQHIQAIALREAIQSHRLNNKCMGTLFWQLNDCWPGPSWSIINYDQTKKVGYDVVKNLYSPQMVSVDTTDGKIDVWAVSDSPDTMNVSLKIEVVQGFNMLLQKSIPVDLNFLEAKKVYEFDSEKILKLKDIASPYISLTLKDRNNGKTLFEDRFYLGLTPQERLILALPEFED